MKIGVVGCGALGSYYGAHLLQAGHEVHFLLRSDYEAVRRDGVSIRSAKGDIHARPQCAKEPSEIGPCDLVLIGLKTTANDQFARLISPLSGGQTLLLTLQNGLGNEAELAALFGAGSVLGGLCFVCLNRVAPGVIDHIGHGQVVIGEFNRPPEPRTWEIAKMFRVAGITCDVAQNLEQAHWEKLVWNIPFNGLGVASSAGFESVIEGEVPDTVVYGQCLTTDLLLADPRWQTLVRELMREVITVARRLGYEVPFGFADALIEKTLTMGAYKASTLIDFERRQPLELKSLFLEPLRQAKSAQVETPRLEKLCRVLETISRMAIH